MIVLPDIESPDDFNPNPDAWGRVGPLPYIQRGWCCAEYAIAKINNRIVNADDRAVIDVDRSRQWPTDINECASAAAKSHTSVPSFLLVSCPCGCCRSFDECVNTLHPTKRQTRR